MSEENEMTVTEFLNSLKRIEWYIRKGKQRYELRTAEGSTYLPFIDKGGELFGIKNSIIYFYVFEKGTNKPAEWVSKYLHDMYIEYDMQNPETEKSLEESRELPFSFELTFDWAFVHYLLKKGGFVIFNKDGKREKDYPNRIY